MKLGESEQGLDLYLRMQLAGIQPNKFIFLCVLKICSSVKGATEGRLIHDEIIRSGLEPDMPIRNTLVDMYSKCGSLEEACHVFERLQERDVVSWGAMIAGYAAHDQGADGLEMFKKMWKEGVVPNAVIFLCTLRACGSAEALEQGRLLQSMIIREGIQLDEVIGSAIIDMYLKCGSLDDADNVFDCLPRQDVVSWGVMITGYADQEEGEIALELYEDMLSEGIEPSKLTFLGVLKACWVVGALKLGRSIHTQVILHNFGSDIVLGNATVDMYAKCGSLDEARNVFDDRPSKDGVSFNSLIQGYVQQDLGLPALDLYALMHQRGTKPNKITYPNVLKACSSIRALVEGRHIHAEILRRDFDSDLAIQSALVDMYVKCGSMSEACKLFEAMHTQDVVSWGTIFAGYAQSGDWKSARQCFANMQSQKLKPDAWVFNSILTACSHAGKVEEGRWYFTAMVHEHGIKPMADHFNCMIDLLGRAGRLEEARDMFQSIPEELDANGWTSFLTNCRCYGNKEFGSECFAEGKLLDFNTDASFQADWQKLAQVGAIRA